jgi:SsrA-binding protein
MLADNRKARFNYTVEEKLECGIALAGTEVKSMKTGRFSFSDAYARIKDDEIWLVGFHISPYPYGNIFNHDPDRPRKLLIHRQEIRRLAKKSNERGYTLVPLRFYLKRGIVKLDLGVCVGKKAYDKREVIKKRDETREMQREIRHRL